MKSSLSREIGRRRCKLVVALLPFLVDPFFLRNWNRKNQHQSTVKNHCKQTCIFPTVPRPHRRLLRWRWMFDRCRRFVDGRFRLFLARQRNGVHRSFVIFIQSQCFTWNINYSQLFGKVSSIWKERGRLNVDRMISKLNKYFQNKHKIKCNP